MDPVTATSDVRQQETDVRMTTGQRSQLGGIARLLTGVVPAAMLPDVMQHGDPTLLCYPADRIEEGIIGAATGCELDADHPGVQAPVELRHGVRLEVGIHDDVAPDA